MLIKFGFAILQDYNFSHSQFMLQCHFVGVWFLFLVLPDGSYVTV
jgi:hypothetical protein